MLRRILTVAGREVRSYFDHATAYILLVIFLVINFFFFFRDAYLVGEGSLRPMFDLMPWLLLFFVPAITMRSLAEERRAGTLELVLSQPLGEIEFLLGKFLGVFAFLGVALAGTLGAPIGLSLGADLQWGVVVAQYAGTLFVSAGLVAIGIWASSLTRNQVTAFILGVASIFLFYLLGLEVLLFSLPPALSLVAERLGVLAHFENVARGVIDLRDVLYFASLTAAFLTLSYFSLLREKLSRGRAEYRRLVWGTTGLVGIAILASLLGGELRGRLDLTPGAVYTLSDATKEMLRGLEDVVAIKLFTSRELPAGFGSVKRDVEDMLRDYDATGGENLRVTRRVPDEDEEAREEASRIGIPQIEFNVVGEEEFQVKRGHFGIAVQYAGETETLPVVQRTEDLEYRLTSAIRSLTRESRPVVGFLQGHGEEGPRTTLRRAGARLGDEYEIESFLVDSAAADVPDSIDVVVVAGPQAPVERRSVDALGRFLDRGGSLMLLYSPMRVQRETRFATPLPQPGLDSLLAEHGLQVFPGLAYDLRLNTRVPVRGQSGITFFVQYPLWPVGQAASDHIAVRELGPVLLPWASPLEVTTADTASATVLLATSEFGGRMEGPASVEPTQDWEALAATADLGVQTMAAARTGGGGGRLVVVGSSRFVTDEFLQGYPDNLRFFQNAVDWLAQDEALISIRSKDRTPPPLLFESDAVRDAVKYGNLIGVPVLFVLIGVLRLARRRRLQVRAYGAEGAAASPEDPLTATSS